ncbi:type III secretion apparatus protein OrgA/MxiK [Candidatus Fukatsuia symbiotica]|uniref:Oxidoreductase n=1 Tax=Candidatus Fukatsuia symbiotica TaxID=1878942 RepID=A0A2U8I6T7_9GAMM|nr:type III secretion apparatus protein OrgA/MxiK [Candidatus Fukatsuia symbiotica]AWK13885.1 oxidoreductase [Candidatus Fukatsuia symbiotica]MEA9445780.1 type III secretion apparatus protein OrgA/MxiK [Candidatus Fukatsuia symbiotica]
MLKLTTIDRILFDPVSYIHHTRFHLPLFFSGSRSRSVLNDMLINQYKLDIERPVIADFNQQLVKHWYILPQISFLIACQRHRALLSRRGVLQSLPSWVQQFAKLEIAAALPCQVNKKIDFIQLLADGVSELGIGSNEIPPAISQRISLLFPSTLTITPNINKNTNPRSLLITLATQHAQKHPYVLDFIGA